MKYRQFNSKSKRESAMIFSTFFQFLFVFNSFCISDIYVDKFMFVFFMFLFVYLFIIKELAHGHQCMCVVEEFCYFILFFFFNIKFFI